MTNDLVSQKSNLSPIPHLNPGYDLEDIPEKWRPKYIIKRVAGEDLGVGLVTRNRILQALDKGKRFVQVGENTVMLNSINTIDPKWGTPNRPNRPELAEEISGEEFDSDRQVFVTKYTGKNNQDEIDLWNKLFGKL